MKVAPPARAGLGWIREAIRNWFRYRYYLAVLRFQAPSTLPSRRSVS